MSEFVALLFILEPVFEGIKAYFLVKHCISVAKDVKNGRRPKLSNIFGVLMGFDLFPVDINLIGEGNLDATHDAVVDGLMANGKSRHATSHAAATLLKLKTEENGMLKAVEYLITSEPDLIPQEFTDIGVSYIHEYIQEENVVEMKNMLANCLKS